MTQNTKELGNGLHSSVPIILHHFHKAKLIYDLLVLLIEIKSTILGIALKIQALIVSFFLYY